MRSKNLIKLLQAELREVIEQQSDVQQEAKTLVHKLFFRPKVVQLLPYGGHPAVCVEDSFTNLQGRTQYDL